jgi:hypothetical protein
MANHSLQTTAFCPWKDYRCNDLDLYGDLSVRGLVSQNMEHITQLTNSGTAVSNTDATANVFKITTQAFTNVAGANQRFTFNCNVYKPLSGDTATCNISYYSGTLATNGLPSVISHSDGLTNDVLYVDMMNVAPANALNGTFILTVVIHKKSAVV